MRSGILNVRKPAGPSSFAVVRAVRRLTGERSVGHGGTLDPAAEGVLPVLLGRATRVAEFIHEWPKTYLATLQLGFTSDTDDAEGLLTERADPSAVSSETINGLLPAFTGRIGQVPPIYSAIKRGGEALYRKARRGEPVRLEPRQVEIYSLRLIGQDRSRGQCRLEICCGSGTYIRSLARDIGEQLGCGAYLFGLTRTAVGPLRLAEAVTPDQLAEAGEAWAQWLLPMDLPLRSWPALILEAERARAVVNGQPIVAPEAEQEGRHRLLDGAGSLIAWGMVQPGGRVQLRAVFPP